MGLFSGKTETYVSSTAYNLAGDVDLRVQVIPATVLRSIMSDSRLSLGSQIKETLLTGSAIKQRRFFRWAQKNYGFGMPDAHTEGVASVDGDTLRSGLGITLTTNQMMNTISTSIAEGSVDYFAEDWMRVNRPEVTSWRHHYVESTQQIRIEIGIETPTLIAAPADLIWALGDPTNRKLLYALYQIVTLDKDTGVVTFGAIQFVTYRMGSGNVVFDTLVTGGTDQGEFFPALPLRLKDTPISQHAKFATVKKGYRTLTGSHIEEILEQIEENENIGDVDFCFLVLGVSLNTPEQVGQAYVFEFLRRLMSNQAGVSDAHLRILADSNNAATDSWWLWEDETATKKAEYDAAYAQWEIDYAQWESDCAVTTAEGGTCPLPPEEPAKPDYTDPPSDSMRVASAPPDSSIRIRMPGLEHYDVTISWYGMTESTGTGNAKSFDGAGDRGTLKVGDYWQFTEAPIQVSYKIATMSKESGYQTVTREYPVVSFFHQVSETGYRRIRTLGLEHSNKVYAGESVSITATEAIADAEESGFIVPMHYPTIRALGLKDHTQLGTSNAYLVFNSYEQVKKKWYQTGWFKVVVVIAAVTFSIYTAGASLGASSGILGTNAAVGAALGASAATAAIVGAVANALAAIVLTSIITKGATMLFGEKWGAIIGTILSIAAMQYGAQYGSTGNFNVDWGQLMRAENLIKLTDSVGNAYSKWLSADTMEIQEEMTKLQETHSEKLKEIEELTKDILGMTDPSMIAMVLSDASEQFEESSEAFLGRTLLTGSDIAQLSFNLVESFADISLELPRQSS